MRTMERSSRQPVVRVVQLDQHAIRVVPSQLGANGSLLQGLPRSSPEYIHGTNLGTAGSSEARSDVDSTDVVYKIQQWSLPGAVTTGRNPLRCFLAEVFSSMAGRSWPKAYGRHYAAGPSGC